MNFEIEHVADLLEREAERLRLLDELDSADKLRRIKAVIRFRALRLRKQTRPLVEMQRLDPHACLFGNFSDF